MTAMNEMYDSALLGVLQSEGHIAKFLDTVFGFLYRKTDFYLTMKDKSARMGFPPGVAQKLTLGAYKKYEELARRNEGINALGKEKASNKPSLDQGEKICPDDIKPSKEMSAKNEIPSSEKVNQAKPEADNEEKQEKSKPEKEIGEKKPTPSTQEEKSKEAKSGDVANDEEDDDEGLAEMQKKFQANSESYNGAMRDNYSWSQSVGDVDVHATVPTHVRKGGDVKVEIEKKRLKVLYKDSNGEFVTSIDGALTWDIVKDESMWTLSPGQHVHINLEKHKERWWEALLADEPKISVRKIDPSRPITDLDDEAQAKIEEMMFNEHQKRLGKPQTHETKVHDMLKKAWDAEGSPFKGQAFDPSVVKVSNPGQLGGMM